MQTQSAPDHRLYIFFRHGVVVQGTKDPGGKDDGVKRHRFGSVRNPQMDTLRVDKGAVALRQPVGHAIYAEDPAAPRHDQKLKLRMQMRV